MLRTTVLLGPVERFARKGIEVLGPFPGDAQSYIVMVAGVGQHARQASVGRDLIKFLTGPAASSVIKAKGMER